MKMMRRQDLEMVYFVVYALQFCSVGLKVCKAITMVYLRPSLDSFMRMIPQVKSVTSVVSMKSWMKSVNQITGVEERHFLNFFIGFFCPYK